MRKGVSNVSSKTVSLVERMDVISCVTLRVVTSDANIARGLESLSDESRLAISRRRGLAR